MPNIPYLAGIGSLMYALMGSRPDITFATNKLSQYNADPGPAHWTALQRVFCYLKKNRNHCLTLGGKEMPLLGGYMDSDYTGCIYSHHSTSGYLFMLGDCLISWSSKHQAIVTTSTCEAEYVASCHDTKEAVWLRNLLDLLGHT